MREERVARGVEAVVLVTLAAIAALLLVKPLRQVPLRILANYNEGWNAFHAQRAFGPGPLYPAPTSLVSNNYPPLSYLAVGAVGLAVGDQVVAGRAVALASLLAAAALLGGVARRAGASRSVALWAALALVGMAALHYGAYVGIDDPQWLAHAMMLAGLLVLLARRPRPAGVALGAGLMLAGGLVKHSLLPLPVAATVWLALDDRASLRAWLAAAAIGTLVSVAVLGFAFGGDLFSGIVYAPRVYRAADALAKLPGWLAPLVPFLAASVLAVALGRREPATRLVGLYALAAALWAAVISGGAGVAYNAVFDLLIASTLGAALAVEQLARRAHEAGRAAHAVRAGALLLLSLPILVPAPSGLARDRAAMQRLALRRAITEQDVAFLVAHPGPALCEKLALCYWAGKRFEVDVFNTGQKLRTGALDEAALGDLLDAHHFAVLELESPNVRLPRSVLERALRGYEVARRSPQAGVFLVPRAGPEAAGAR